MNSYRETAEVIQFPPGGRAGLNSRHSQPAAAQEISAPRIVVSGGSWYHDEAIRDEHRAANR